MFDENKELMFNQFVHGLRSPRIDKYKRAMIINEYLVYKDLSQRQFGVKFNIPHNTVQDWLLPLRVSEDKYNQLRNKYTSTQLYRFLRDNKDINIDVNQDFLNEILVFSAKLKHTNVRYIKYDDKFLEIIDRLKKSISYFEFKVETRTNKNGGN